MVMAMVMEVVKVITDTALPGHPQGGKKTVWLEPCF
jgi:hypothetical protein